jgi:plasmid stability protein
VPISWQCLNDAHPSLRGSATPGSKLVDALKQRAARHGRSAEAEHRSLLEASLLRPRGKSFAEALAAMPNVGQDEDFERVEDQIAIDHVFG